MHKYRIGQSAQRHPEIEGYFNWSIWIEEDPGRLAGIESVKYLLHPSFKNSVVTKDDPTQKFILKAQGWGEFSIKVIIRERSGQETAIEYWLILGDNYSNLTGSPEDVPSNIGEKAGKKVFLSYSTYDNEFADALEKSLIGQGIDVITIRDIPYGMDYGSYLEEQIAICEAYVTIVPPFENFQLDREAQLANASSTKIIPVIIQGESTGGSRSIPNKRSLQEQRSGPDLESVQAIYVKDLNDVQGIARRISESLEEEA